MKYDPLLNYFLKSCMAGMLLLSSCGSLLDISGKGARKECLSLDCSDLRLSYRCDDRSLFSVNVSEYQPDGTRKRSLSEDQFSEFTNEFRLPQPKDSLTGKYITLFIRISDSHHREAWYIDLKPGDIEKKKKLSARYFSH